MMNEKEKLYDTLLQLGTALREKRAHAYGAVSYTHLTLPTT